MSPARPANGASSRNEVPSLLFKDAVEHNIAYGQPGATRAQVEEAATPAHIHNFISGTPAGYGTMVGERSLMLSGGEKAARRHRPHLAEEPAHFNF